MWNKTVQLLCSISIIFTCPGYWKSRGISCGLESGHPVLQVMHNWHTHPHMHSAGVVISCTVYNFPTFKKFYIKNLQLLETFSKCIPYHTAMDLTAPLDSMLNAVCFHLLSQYIFHHMPSDLLHLVWTSLHKTSHIVTSPNMAQC